MAIKPGHKGKNGEQALAALVRFAELPLGAPAYLQEARAALRTALQDGPAVVVGDAAYEIAAWPASKVAALQSELMSFLRGLVGLRDQGDDESTLMPKLVVTKLELSAVALPLKKPTDPQPPRSPGAVFLAVDGSAEDVIRYQLLLLLSSFGTSTIQRCGDKWFSNPERLGKIDRSETDCTKLYVENGRREFCSTLCQKRVYQRGFYQQNEARPKKESRHGKTRKR